MWKYLTILLMVFCISNAYADSTKQMPQFDLLTTGAADDTIWVYDTSANSLYRMTAQEFIQDYLASAAGYATNNVLRADGLGGVDWSVFASVSGTGVTTIDTDSGSALSVFSGNANRVGFVGGYQINTVGSGNTVTVNWDGSVLDASAFSGETDFALHSEVTAFVAESLTARTNASAFTGTTAFIKTDDAVESTEIVRGGASKYFVYSGATLTGDMLAGGMIFCHGASALTLGIPTFSGSTGYFGVWDMTGAGVTIQTTDSGTLYNADESGTAVFVNAGNSRHSAAFTLNAESGSCTYVVTLSVNGDEWITQ